MHRKTVLIVFFNLIIFFLSLLFYPEFQTNDDLGMIFGYSGNEIFDNQTSFTVFSTKLWGQFLVFLYRYLSFLPYEIYTIVFVILIFVSFVIIQSKLLKDVSILSWKFWLVLGCLSLVVSLQYFLKLQFTMVSGIVALAGFILFITRQNKKELVLAYLFIIVATCIRPTLIPIALFFFIFFYFVGMLFSGLPFINVIKKSSFLLLLLALPVGVYLLDNVTLNKKEKQFLEFNTFRANIVDYKINERLDFSNEMKQLSWEKEELYLFKSWFYNDNILYNRDKPILVKSKYGISELTKDMQFSSELFISFINLFNQITFRCILLVMLLPLILSGFNPRVFGLFCLYIISTLLLYILVAVIFKVPPFRMTFFLISSSVLFYFYFTIKYMKLLKVNITSVLSSFVILYIGLLCKIDLMAGKERVKSNRCISHYDDKTMYIRWANYPFEHVNPYTITTGKSRSKEQTKVKIMSMGAFAVHPAVDYKFRNFEFNNLTGDIIGRDSLVSFILPDNAEELGNFKENYINFIKKHYKKDVYFEKVSKQVWCVGYSEFKLKEKIKNATTLD